jgi:hypothetical protein
MTATPARSHIATAAVILMVGSATLAWWLIGDVSEPGGSMSILPAPPLSSAQSALAGVVGLIADAVAGRWLVNRSCRRQLAAAGGRLAILVGLVGFAVGSAGRVLTSRTVGANIGGGMIILVAPIALVALAVYAVRLWRTLDAGS